MNFLKKFYRGQYSLVKTFWLYGLIPLSIYAGLLAVAESKGMPSIALNAVKIPGLIYTLLWMAGAWQSAKQYQGWEVSSRGLVKVDSYKTAPVNHRFLNYFHVPRARMNTVAFKVPRFF